MGLDKRISVRERLPFGSVRCYRREKILLVLEGRLECQEHGVHSNVECNYKIALVFDNSHRLVDHAMDGLVQRVV